MIIAFTVHNRPAYLRETLESWSKVRGIGDHALIFRCEPGCPEAAGICESVDFAPALTVRNHLRLGVLGNPQWAFHHGFFMHAAQRGYPLRADFVVLAEEDMVVSPDVIEYFAWCQRYQDDPGVLGVTTYQHHERPGGLPGAGAADWRADSEWHFWVWGTWRDRWDHLLRDSWDLTYDENGGGPLQRGWDWNIRNRLVLGEGMRMIAPSLCRSQHIGKEGGAHCTPGQFEGLLSSCFAGPDVPPQDYQEVCSCLT